MPDAVLRSAAVSVGVLRGLADRYAALAAGELARRSSHELGAAGMARSAGFSSTEHLVQSLTGTTRREAGRLVRVRAVLAEAASDPGGVAGILAGSVESGALSIDGLDSIRSGLGVASPGVSEAHLVAQCERVLADAADSTPEQLNRAARQARDLLDDKGVERREIERRELRSLRTWRDASGMFCGRWRLPAEEGQIVQGAIDAVLSPRLGGPRFVEPVARQRADDMLHDERSTEQIGADVLVDLIRLAVDADPGTLFGRHRPAVQVIVTEPDLTTHTGHGRLEGNLDAVSAATVDRYVCDTGLVAVGFDDDGQAVNVGRTRRQFTERQRIGMALRDGGCRANCDRPPAFCEAHHINQWTRDGGETNIADGILLCRRHHLDVHNNGWDIVRDGARYYLRPPASLDPDRTPIEMHSHNPIKDRPDGVP
jgi:hypothetical protein